MRFSLTTLLCIVTILGAMLGIYVRSKDELILKLPCPSGKFNAYTVPRFSDDGRLLFHTTPDNTVCIYDLESMKVIRSVKVPGKGVTEINAQLSSDSTWLNIIYYQENGQDHGTER